MNTFWVIKELTFFQNTQQWYSTGEILGVSLVVTLKYTLRGTAMNAVIILLGGRETKKV